MSDGAGRAHRDAREAEERAAVRSAGMTDEQLFAAYDWHNVCADALAAEIKRLVALQDAHDLRKAEVWDAWAARRHGQ